MTSGEDVVSGDGERRVWVRALAVGFVLAGLAFSSTGPARQTFDSMLLMVFPHRVTMQVAPGNVRVRSGSPLGINARLVGGPTQSAAQVEMGDGNQWRTVDMTVDKDGRFRLRLDAITGSFKYRVLAGAVTSPTYSVLVVYPPHVTGIDLDYSYPEALGLKPRHEGGTGNIDAPAGTNVQVRIHVDKPTSGGTLALASGERVVLVPVNATELTVGLTIEGDNAYRIVLSGADGVRGDGEMEYTIHAHRAAAASVPDVLPAPPR